MAVQKLDLSKEMFMANQPARVVTQTPDGGYVVKGAKTGRLLMVDAYGNADGKQKVWNRSTRIPSATNKFKPGELAYKIRITTTQANVLSVGKVVAVEHDKVWVAVEGKKSTKHPQGLFKWFTPYLFDSYDKVETFLKGLEQAVDELPPPLTILRKAGEKA